MWNNHYNSLVMLNYDRNDEYQADPNFGRKMTRLVKFGEEITGVAKSVVCIHTDNHSLVRFGSESKLLHMAAAPPSSESVKDMALLKEYVASLGFKLVKRGRESD